MGSHLPHFALADSTGAVVGAILAADRWWRNHADWCWLCCRSGRFKREFRPARALPTLQIRKAECQRLTERPLRSTLGFFNWRWDWQWDWQWPSRSTVTKPRQAEQRWMRRSISAQAVSPRSLPCWPRCAEHAGQSRPTSGSSLGHERGVLRLTPARTKPRDKAHRAFEDW